MTTIAMSDDTSFEMAEGQVYTIGRVGHIRIEDMALSRGHAELRMIDGKLRLRDLSSTNGTYLVSEKGSVSVTECFVEPDQRIIIGNGIYTVLELIEMASDPDSEPKGDSAHESAYLDTLVSKTISQMMG